MLVKRYLAPSDFTAAETWRLVEWCNNLGADEFTIDFHYEPLEGGWFEDPVIYREGRLMLGTLSHEAFAVLCLSDLESAQLAAAGFPSHDSLPRIG